MSGFFGTGRLQEEEWLMRAVMVVTRELPPQAPQFTPDTPINTVFTQQSAEFESLLAKLDPEGDIDPERFPFIAFFEPSERWPVDIILGAIAALIVFLFLPNWFGIGKYVAYLGIAAYVSVQFLRARRRQQRQQARMRQLGLTPGERYELTLRKLVKFRRQPLAQGAPDNVTIH